MDSPHRLHEGTRMLVSAPRPDSFMLRMRSLREAGQMAISPARRVWQKAGWQGMRVDTVLRDDSLPTPAR